MQLVVFSKRLQTLLKCYQKSSVHFCVNTTAKSWLGQFCEKQSVFCTAAEVWNQFTGFSIYTWFPLPVQHKLNYNMHQSAIISKNTCFTCSFVSDGMVSAITSPDRTGAKVYYQSGPGLVPVRARTGNRLLIPVRAMEASQPFGGQCPRLPLKMKLALTRTTEP